MRVFLLLLPLLAPLATEPPEDAEAKVVKAITNLGGSVTRDEVAPRRPVVAVDFRKRVVDASELKELAALSELQSLGLAHSKVTTAALKSLARLKKLSSLDLTHAEFDERDLKELAAVARLRTLVFDWGNLTDYSGPHCLDQNPPRHPI